MNSAPSSQMNIRIDAALKERGDDALSSIGFTPTQAVRALWERASQRGQQLEEVKQLLQGTKMEAHLATAEDSPLSTGRRIVPEGLSSLGISEHALAQASQDESALLDAAMMDRASQKGWL